MNLVCKRMNLVLDGKIESEDEMRIFWTRTPASIYTDFAHRINNSSLHGIWASHPWEYWSPACKHSSCTVARSESMQGRYHHSTWCGPKEKMSHQQRHGKPLWTIVFHSSRFLSNYLQTTAGATTFCFRIFGVFAFGC